MTSCEDSPRLKRYYQLQEAGATLSDLMDLAVVDAHALLDTPNATVVEEVAEIVQFIVAMVGSTMIVHQWR